MKQYTYYPGCSLKGTGRAYEESLLAVCEALDLSLNELEDWNCCGATAYMSVDESKALALAARNLALAEKSSDDMVVPCSGCYLVLGKTKKTIQDYPETSESVGDILNRNDLDYQGKVQVRHPLEVLLTDVGLEAIKQRVVRPLTELKIAPYYGCQIVRPYATFDHQIYPTGMDRLFEALGAEVVPYPLKTRCCGGSLTGTINEVGLRLVYILLKEAQKREANVIVTLCPLCHFNLDSYQDQVAAKYDDVALPVLYFTQVIGLALGLAPEKLGLQRHLVSTAALSTPAEPVAAS